VSVAAKSGFNADAVRAGISDQATKDRTKAEVDKAIGIGAFGSPYIVIDGEPFWGSDRLEQIDKWLARAAGSDARYICSTGLRNRKLLQARLYLELVGADWKPRFVDYFNGETRTPDTEDHAMGEAPVLEHGKLRLAQSGSSSTISSSASAASAGAKNAERREILRWLLWDNHKLTGYTATLPLSARTSPRASAPPRTRRSSRKFGKRARVVWKITGLAHDGRRYVVGDRLTIADISSALPLFRRRTGRRLERVSPASATGSRVSAPSRAEEAPLRPAPGAPRSRTRTGGAMSAIKSRLNPDPKNFKRTPGRWPPWSPTSRQVDRAAQGGEERRASKHVARGKLLRSERLRLLLDPGSPFLELSSSRVRHVRR